MVKKRGGRRGKASADAPEEQQPQPGPSTSAPPQQAFTSQHQAEPSQPAKHVQPEPGFQTGGGRPQPPPGFERGTPPPQEAFQQQQPRGGRGEAPKQRGGRGRGRGAWQQGAPRPGFGRGTPTTPQEAPQESEAVLEVRPKPGQAEPGFQTSGEKPQPPPGFGRGTPPAPQEAPQQQQPGGGRGESPQQRGGRGRGRGGWHQTAPQSGFGRETPTTHQEAAYQHGGQQQRGRGRGRGRGGWAQPGSGRGQPQEQRPQQGSTGTAAWAQQPSLEQQLESMSVEDQPGRQEPVSDEEFLKLLKYKPGTAGRRIRVETNHLKLNLGNLKQAYRYDVSVEPDRPKKMVKTAMRFFRDAHFPGNYPSYDGQKLLYSAKRLPLADDAVSGSVKLHDDNDKEKEFKITIKMSGVLDLSPLQLNNLLQKNIEQADAFQCVEIVFRQAYIDSFITVGRRFYTLPTAARQYPVGEGAEMYLGGYQSAVQGWKHFLNVDVAHKAFTTAINLKDLVNEMCNRNPLSDEQLKTYKMWPKQCEQVNGYIKGLKVIYQIPNHPGSKKVYKVNRLERSAAEATFDENGRKVTVQEYYLKKYHYKIQYPNLPTVWVGNKGTIFLPLECCTLQEGQPIDGARMTDNQVAKMIRFAATSTTERKKKIINIIRTAGYNRNPCIREFGFSVAEEFQKVDARVLNPPRLQYSNGTVGPQRGQWRAQQFRKGAEIRRWTIVAVGLQRERVNADVGKLARMIVEFGRSCGMSFSKPEEPFQYCDHRDIARCLSNKKNFDLVVVVIPPFNKDVYYSVKQAAEQSVGCLTQCIKADTLYERKLNASTVGNILLKINSKLNGTNHTLCDLDLLAKEPCLVMGADVTHPSPQAKSIHPSVVAVTGSHDLAATAYNVDVTLQRPRETMSEIIQDLEEITLKKLQRFKVATGKEPGKIYFFRDGVSDGEFDRVREVEIKAVEKACGRFRRGYRPKITFLVVQKRHHTRLFPMDDSATDGDRNFNVPAGTCVDTEIVNATLQNFYLVSHASIQGVAKPTKYCTLYDENGLSNDDVQKLTYYLCHVYMRCNRAVSYPAPTYYAHLMADRAKGYLHGKQINMEELDQRLIKIVDAFAQNNPMFFC